MDFIQQDAETLGDKLDAMDLTDGERSALVAVFEAAADEEVSGFAYDLNPNDLSFKVLTQKAMRSSRGVDGVVGPQTRRFHEHQNP